MLYYPEDFIEKYQSHDNEDVRAVERIAHNKIHIFLDIKNVLMDFTSVAKAKLECSFPCPQDGVLRPNPIYGHTTTEIFQDICQGYDLYNDCPKYPWSDALWSEFYKISNGNVYTLVRHNQKDMEGLGGKAKWILRYLGTYGYDRTFLLSEKHIFPFSDFLHSHHILIDTNLENIKKWCQQGGTGFLWEEIDTRTPPDKFRNLLSDRLHELRKYIDGKVIPKLIADMIGTSENVEMLGIDNSEG